MSDSSILTLVFGFRDRDVERVRRSLDSLKHQTFRNFDVVFVDYGSWLDVAILIRALVEEYSFCRYIYSDTRGRPWNRSHALNIGVRLSIAEYVLTTDVDIVFPANFLEIVAQNIHPERVLYCYPHYLPKGFQDWDNLSAYLGKLPTGNTNARGGCQVVPRKIFFQLGGFDEYYQYWGVEDRDLHHRLTSSGLQEFWLNDQTHIFHQWHSQVNYSTSHFMPQGFWGRANVHYHRHFNVLTRNGDRWGRIYTTEERQVFRFLNFETRQIIMDSEMTVFENQVYRNEPLGDFVRSFYELSAGCALAVNHAYFPERHWFIDGSLYLLNRALFLFKEDSRIAYNFNLLHSFLSEFIEFNPDLVADYYLGFPAGRGMSILVRA